MNDKEHEKSLFTEAQESDPLHKAIGERIRLVRKRSGLSRGAMAKMMNIGISTLQYYENGFREPSIRFVIDLATSCGASVEWIIFGTGSAPAALIAEFWPPGLGEPSGRVPATTSGAYTPTTTKTGTQAGTQDSAAGLQYKTREVSTFIAAYVNWQTAVDINDFVAVRYFPNIRAGAGLGAFSDPEHPPTAMLFSRQFIHQGLNADPAALLVVKVWGDSMAPTIKRDGNVLLDLSKGLSGEGIYLIRVGESLMLKRLQILTGSKIKVISDNPAYESYEIDLAITPEREFSVLGQYCWDAGIAS